MKLVITKIVVFRKVHVDEKWQYDNKEIKVIDNFTFFGVLLNFNDKKYLICYMVTKKNCQNKVEKHCFLYQEISKDYYTPTLVKVSYHFVLTF